MDYVGQAVPTNSVEVDAWTGNYQDEQDQFAENEKLLIVLTGKYTASAAEQFVDAIHNVENVLIVGENTNGCILTAAGSSYLPNSNAPMVLGANLVHVFPGEGFFEELPGGFIPTFGSRQERRKTWQSSWWSSSIDREEEE